MAVLEVANSRGSIYLSFLANHNVIRGLIREQKAVASALQRKNFLLQARKQIPFVGIEVLLKKQDFFAQLE